MKSKKWVMAMLLAVMVAVVAACGSSSNGNSSNGGTSTNTPGTGTTTESTPAPAPEVKPTLKALQIWQNEDYNTYPVAKLLEEATGYKVQYDMLPADNPADKLNLMIASGEAYDLVTTTGSNDFKALYADYAQKGALTDLTQLIEEHGPNIKAMISQDSFDALKVDGKIYTIPTRALVNVGRSLMIRVDWLEELNLEIPTTIEEFVAVLEAFKANDPGGNGAQNIPMTINNMNIFVDNLVGAFGMPNEWNPVDGQLVPRALDPRMADYLSFVKGLYDDGLLDREFAVNVDATVKEKFSSGRAGVVPLHWADIPAIMDALEKNQPGAKAVFLSPLIGADGMAGLSAATGFDRLTYIPRSAENPVDAIKWIDAKLEKDLFKLMAIGEEGVHHTFENGTYTPILPIFNEERNLANNFLSGTDEANYPTYWQARVRKDMRLFEAWELLNLKQPQELRVVDPLAFSPYLPSWATNAQQLGAMTGDFAIQVVAGAETVDGIPGFQQRYKSSGGEASVQEINDWYNSR